MPLVMGCLDRVGGFFRLPSAGETVCLNLLSPYGTYLNPLKTRLLGKEVGG